MGKVIAVSNNKGGICKTTTVVNLASVYALQGKRVLIIDMDNQGSALLSFGIIPNHINNTIYEVLVEGLKPEQAIMSVHENIDILPANRNMRYFEATVPGANKLLRLKETCDHLRAQYDIIFVDSPPTLSITQGNILAFADEVIIPFQPEIYAQLSLIEMVDAIKDIQNTLNSNLKIKGILATLVEKRSSVHREILKEAEQYCQSQGLYMFKTMIPRTVRFATLLKQEAQPAVLIDPKHAGVKQYFELEKELAQHDKEHQHR